MKNIFRFLLLVLIICLTGTGKSSAAAIRDSVIGIKAGINLSNVGGDYFSNPSSQTGFIIGMYYKQSISRDFALQVECLYTQQGTNSFTYVENIPGKMTLNFDYIAVPFLLKIGSRGRSGFAANIFGGLMAEYNLNATTKFSALGSVVSVPINNPSPLNFDLVGGISFEPRIGKTYLNLDIRYNYGLGSMLSGNGASMLDKTVAITFGVGM